MKPLPFGELHFAVKTRIRDAHSAIESLAFLGNVTLTDAASFQEEASLTDSPLNFICLGETNSGKSSFLNALIQDDLCAVDDLPQTKEIQIHQLEEASSPEIISHKKEHLRDIRLIDTPGSDRLSADALLKIKELCSTSEIIFFAFHIDNPWAASTWNIISSIPKEDIHRTVILITHADQQTEKDLEVIKYHIEELEKQKLHYAPPIIAISSTLGTGLQNIWKYISATTFKSPERNELLRHSCQRALNRLELIEEQFDQKAYTLNHQSDFLTTLEQEIDDMREGYVKTLPIHLEDIALVFVTEAEQVTTALKKRLSYFPSLYRLFMGDFTGSVIEQQFAECLRLALDKVAQTDALDIVSNCKNHWYELEVRINLEIGENTHGENSMSDRLDAAKEHFIASISTASSQTIADLKVRRSLEYNLRKRNIALKSFTASMLVFFIFAAITGILDHATLSLIFLAIFWLFFAGSFIVAFLTQSQISLAFKDSLKNTCGQFVNAMKIDYEQELRVFFDEYKFCLSGIRRHLANEQISIAPSFNQLDELRRTVKSIEQDLR